MERNFESQSDETILKALIDLAEHRPRYLRPQLVRICDLMIKVSYYNVDIIKTNADLT